MPQQNSTPRLELPTCDDRLLWDIWMSTGHMPTLTVADELGLFSLLDRAPATIEEVAASLSLGARGAEAMLGVLASLGFLAQHQGRFYITGVSRNYLLPESPYYWGGVLHPFRELTVSHALVRDALQRDKPVSYETESYKLSDGIVSTWEAPVPDVEQIRTFTRMMHSHALPAAMGVAHRGDFTGVRWLLDVGGGSGCFCIALALRYPEMRFTVVDLPVVCELAQQYVADYRLQDRIDTQAIDMFNDPWPADHDAVFFSDIFHDWGIERCRYLGQRSFEVLPPDGRIYIHEILLADTKDGPLPAASYSMQMMLATQGKQLSLGELDELLRACGFEDVSAMQTYGYYSLISGRKPSSLA